MDALLELVLTIILEPVLTLLFEVPLSSIEQSITAKRKPKWLIVLLGIIVLLCFFALIAAIIAGAVLVYKSENNAQKIAGIVLLSVGGALFVAYVVFSVTKYILDNRYEHTVSEAAVQSALSAAPVTQATIGRQVYVLVDRPIGTAHPVYDDVTYSVNFGFVPGVMKDDKYQDAYVLGIDEPVTQFNGVLKAIIHRHDIGEDVWVVAPEAYNLTDDEITRQTEFLEKCYRCTLIR